MRVYKSHFSIFARIIISYTRIRKLKNQAPEHRGRMNARIYKKRKFCSRKTLHENIQRYTDENFHFYTPSVHARISRIIVSRK